MRRLRSWFVGWVVVAVAATVPLGRAQDAVDPRVEAALAEILASEAGLAFFEAFRAIRRDYMGTADSGALLEGALRGMVDAVADPYVAYLDTEDLREDHRRSRDPDVVVSGAFGDLGYLHLLSFDSDRSGERFAAELTMLLELGVRGLVVDLRGNPGGLVLGGLQVLDLFLSDGVLGYRETRFGQIPLGFANPRAVSLPVAVLVDGRTASTAEIVAGALQSSGRARLYGEVTAGKGVGQSAVPLANGGELRLVTFAWSLPDGRSIDRWGLTPDVPIREGRTAGPSTGMPMAVVPPESDPVLAVALRDLRRILGADLGVSESVDADPPIEAEP